MSRVNPLSSLSLLAVLVLAGCSSQAPQPLKKGEKAIDVASVVRQKMPASVKDRDAWAKDLATTFESQGLAPTLENVCSVLAVAQDVYKRQALLIPVVTFTLVCSTSKATASYLMQT